MLMSYVSGSVSPGIALLVKAHAEQVPDSRADLSELQAFGGALLSSTPAEAMSETALSSVLGKLDQLETAPAQRVARDPGPLPQAIADAIGVDFQDIPWKWRLPGLAEYEFDDFDGETVSLIRAKPGTRIPQHTHEGREATLILTGALRDGDIVYHRGDISLTDERDDHRPEIVGDEVCHCLAVVSGSLRYTGFFSRALNYLAE